LKSTATHAKPKLTEFPCLMCSRWGSVVLFTDPFTGTVVLSAPGNTLGFYSDKWTASDFKPFYGSVTFEND
jgi:hypothetical protein